MNNRFILVVFLIAANSVVLNAQNFAWAKQLARVTDQGRSIAVDTTGNVYTTGMFSGGDFDPGSGTYNLYCNGGRDVFVSKLNSSGDFVWAKQIGAGAGDDGNCISLDDSGNIYLTGYFELAADFDPGIGTYYLASAGNDDIFLSKWDASANFVWARQIGGTLNDFGRSIKADNQGNVYVAGDFTSVVDFDPDSSSFTFLSSLGIDDAFICKFNPAGQFLWAKQFGGTYWDRCNSIDVDDDGNVYATGLFNDTVDFDPGAGVFNLVSAGDDDIFITKLDSSGNFGWAMQIGGGSDDRGLSLKLDSYGNLVATGSFHGTVDFDPGTGIFNLAGSFAPMIFVLKLDLSGNFRWAISLGGIGGDQNGNSIAVDASGSVYTSGYFYGSCDFDPGPGTYNLTPVGAQDVFISKLDSSGNFVWAGSMGSGSSDYGYAVAADATGNIFSTGWFQGTADFDPGGGTFNLTTSSLSGGSIFVQKLGVIPTGIEDISNPTFGLIPNPSSGLLNIVLPKPQSYLHVSVTDLTGKVILVQRASQTHTMALSTTALPDGIYFVRVESPDFVSAQKFVVTHSK